MSVARGPKSVLVRIEDRGPGIPADLAERLFEPYFQLRPTAPGNDGLGLGLAIVKSIIAAHGGQIQAENRRGGGACFWFELPMISDC